MTEPERGTVAQAPEDHRRDAPLRWAVGGLVVALVALVALGAWVYHDRSTSTTAAPAAVAGLAPPTVAAMLASRVAAVNNQDKQTLMSVYAPDAVIEERDQTPPVIYSGNARIADVLTGYRALGWSLAQTGVAVQQDRFVSEPLEWSGGSGIAVYELDAQGRIVHQWVVGG